MKVIIIRGLLAIVLIGIGLGAGLGFGQYQLKNAILEHTQATEKMERKLLQWQNKYNERNAQIEIGRRNAQRQQQELVALKEQVDGLQLSEAAALKKKTLQIAELKVEIGKLESQWLRLQATEERVTADLAVRTQRVAELEKLSTELQQKSALLDQDLRKKNSDYERCYKHNLEMAKAAGELMERYQNKHLWSALSQREPLTGIGKVELEHMLQEYGFKVEDHRLAN